MKFMSEHDIMELSFRQPPFPFCPTQLNSIMTPPKTTALGHPLGKYSFSNSKDNLYTHRYATLKTIPVFSRILLVFPKSLQVEWEMIMIMATSDYIYQTSV